MQINLDGQCLHKTFKTPQYELISECAKNYSNWKRLIERTQNMAIQKNPGETSDKKRF